MEYKSKVGTVQRIYRRLFTFFIFIYYCKHMLSQIITLLIYLFILQTLILLKKISKPFPSPQNTINMDIQEKL